MNVTGKVWRFYADGFKNMTWGRLLWLIILVKLFIIFIVLRLLFFPDFLATHSAAGDKGGYVSRELIERGTSPAPLLDNNN